MAAVPWAAVGLSNSLGRARKENITLSTLLLQRYNVNVLSAARFFLFGSRDMWFEVRVVPLCGKLSGPYPACSGPCSPAAALSNSMHQPLY